LKVFWVAFAWNCGNEMDIDQEAKLQKAKSAPFIVGIMNMEIEGLGT